jgi:hypothetical protein
LYRLVGFLLVLMSIQLTYVLYFVFRLLVNVWQLLPIRKHKGVHVGYVTSLIQSVPSAMTVGHLSVGLSGQETSVKKVCDSRSIADLSAYFLLPSPLRKS